MTLEKITIGSFAGIENKTFVLSDKMNLIVGMNESGKSRIADFIRFIFYGFDSSEPCFSGAEEQTVKANGSLELSCSKGRFRIERSFGPVGRGAVDGSVVVTDLQRNVPVKGNNPASMFLGVPGELFDRSCFMSQLKKRSVGQAELAMAVENMLSSADESISAGKSAEKLSCEIDELEKKGGLIEESEARVSDLEKRLEKANADEEERHRLTESLKENRKKIEANEEDLSLCRSQIEHTDACKRLDRLKRAGEAYARKETLEKQIEELKKTYAANGFYPDRAYVKELNETLFRLKSAREERAALTEQRQADVKELDDLPELPKGKQGKLLDAIGECRRNQTSNKTRFFAFASAALLFLVLSIVFFVSGKILPGVIFAVTSAAGIACAVIFLIRAGKAKEEETELFESVGAKNREQLSDAVEKYAALVARREALEKSMEESGKRAAKNEEALKKLEENAEKLAALWGRSAKTTEALQELTELAQKACDELSEAEEEKKRAEIETLALGETSEEEVRGLLAVVREDGVKKELTPEEYKNCQMKIKFYTQTVDGLNKRVKTQSERLSVLEKTAEDPDSVREELEDSRGQTEELRRRAFIKRAARDAIVESISYMRDAILPQVTEKASGFFEKATNGKYKKVAVNNAFEITVQNEEGQTFPPSLLSGGTVELLYIALRLGLSERLYEREPMFYLFDESFAHFDDLRKAASFMALSEFCAQGSGQVIILSCHKRDAALMERISSFNKIEL